jgi:hypothetical protein
MVSYYFFTPGMYYINPLGVQPVTFVAGASSNPARPSGRDVFEVHRGTLFLHVPGARTPVRREAPGRGMTQFLGELGFQRALARFRPVTTRLPGERPPTVPPVQMPHR